MSLGGFYLGGGELLASFEGEADRQNIGEHHCAGTGDDGLLSHFERHGAHKRQADEKNDHVDDRNRHSGFARVVIPAHFLLEGERQHHADAIACAEGDEIECPEERKTFKARLCAVFERKEIISEGKVGDANCNRANTRHCPENEMLHWIFPCV